MMSSPVRWALAFAACAALVALSVLYVDRPVALFFRGLDLPEHMLGRALAALLLLLPLSAAAVGASAVAAWRGAACPAWLQTLSLAGTSCLCAYAVNDLVLKPLFGRYTVGQFVTYPHPYGFVPFGGNILSGFPSGHTALIVAFVGVCWVAVPRLRLLWGLIAAIVLATLLAAGWHFVSDELAGVFVGAAAARATVAAWRVRRSPSAIAYESGRPVQRMPR